MSCLFNAYSRILCLYLALALVLAFRSLGLAEANGECTNRILAFDSKVVVSTNRDLAVTERIEIANDGGFFDSGLHRHLTVKRDNPQRRKPGSFASIRAKVDGRDAQVTSEQSDILHIGMPAESGSWSRGNHVVELSYTAKNQFLNTGITKT